MLLVEQVKRSMDVSFYSVNIYLGRKIRGNYIEVENHVVLLKVSKKGKKKKKEKMNDHVS